MRNLLGSLHFVKGRLVPLKSVPMVEGILGSYNVPLQDIFIVDYSLEIEPAKFDA